MFRLIKPKSTPRSKRRPRVCTLERLDKRELFAADMVFGADFQRDPGPPAAAIYSQVNPAIAASKTAAALQARSSASSQFVGSSGVSDDHSNLRNSTATPIRLNTFGRANLAGRIDILGDKDVFSLTIDRTQTVVFNANAIPAGFDPFLRLVNSSDRVIASNDDANGTRHSEIRVTLTPGTYYVEVLGFANRSGGSYNLIVQGSPSDDHVNTLTSSATNIALSGSGRGFAFGNLENNRDVDVFRFDITQSRRVTIDLASTSGSSVDTYLRLFRSNGSLVAFDDDGGIGDSSRLTVNLEPGRYYIQASSFGGASSGGYSVTVATSSPVTPITPSDDHVNTLISSATNIPLSSSGRGFAFGNLENNRDVDVFRFDITQSRRVTIDLAATSGSSIDTYLRLFRSNGSLVAFDDDGGIGNSSRLTVTLAPGRYYVQASSFNAASAGRYSVTVVTSASVNGGTTPTSGETLRFSGSGRLFESDSTSQSTKEYKFTAPTTRSYRLQIRGLSLTRGTVEIRNATTGSLVSSRAFNSIANSDLRFNMVAGQAYSMTIRGDSGSNGSFSFTIV